MRRSVAAEVFETQPIGWPFPRLLLAGYGVAFAAGLLLTWLGISMTARVGRATWQIPPFAPLAAVVAGIELVRVARWRSTRYVVIGHRVVVRRGITRAAAVASVDVRDAVVRAWTTGPVVEGTSRTLVLTGLDACAWDALADALRRAGAKVERGLGPPTESAARRVGPSPRIVFALAVLAVVLGAAVEARTRLDRARRAEHERVAARVQAACDVAVEDARPSLFWRRQREDFFAARARWVRAYVGARTKETGSPLGRDTMTIVLDVDWPAAKGTDPGRRTVCVVTCERPLGLVPARPQVTLLGDPTDPLARIVIAHVRAQLSLASIDYSSRSATIQGAASNAP